MAQQSSSSDMPNAPAPAAQNTAAKPAPGVNPSRVDIFLGYSYLAPHGYIHNERYRDVDVGAIGSGAYYFNKYMGAEITVGAHKDGPGDDFMTYSLGPIFRFPTDSITPFVHVAAGAVHMAGPNYDTFLADGVTPIHLVNPYRWGTVLTAGGGMDYPLGFLGHRLAWRVFQADYQYMHTSFGPSIARPLDGSSNIEGGRANINAIQVSTGLVFRIGSIIPPPPVAYTCSASPSDVYPGDPVTVTGNAQNLNPKKSATYSWTATGATVTGTSSTGNVDTANLNPGTYTVTGHVTDGNKAGRSADCNATFTVKAFEPPTVSCSANPTTVAPGDSATITAQGVSPQNRALTYSYSASSGEISGSNTTATLNTTGAAPGDITVTCNVADDKGQTASSTTTVTINAPAPPPAPKTETLCSISFGREKNRPTRVDNEAKACLDDVALNLQRSADAKAILVGNSTASERRGSRAAAERAVNAKAYLVKEKGIDPSRIDVRTGNAGTDTVQNYLVPSGASFDNDVQGTTEVNTSTVKASRNAYGHARSTTSGVHHRHHRAKKAAPAQQ
ncbi:MAG: hypothetical protein ABI164_10675 [Acidobacteriaceae bacterium]